MRRGTAPEPNSLISAQVMTGERSRAYRRLRRTTAQLERRLAPLELVDVAAARRRRAAARRALRRVARRARCRRGRRRSRHCVRCSSSTARAGTVVDVPARVVLRAAPADGGDGRRRGPARARGALLRHDVVRRLLFIISGALLGGRADEGGACVCIGVVDGCVEIKILRRVRAESPHRPPRHRRDTCSMAWRSVSSPLDRARTAASSPRNDLV